jgi:hypothetical protein
MSEDLKIVGVEVRPPSAVTEEDAAHGVQERLHVVVSIENVGTKPLHVWSSRRAYDYDSATNILSLHLAEPANDLPPGITIVSQHPRVPAQVVIEPGSKASIDVPVPTIIRRRTEGEGLGMSFVEEQIEPIKQVELHVQYSDVPFQHVVDESPESRRQRLLAHGTVIRATLAPTSHKE